MTIKLEEGDRIYKMIDAITFGNERKRILSKIDKNGKITVFTYIFGIEDIKEDGTIENKRMAFLLKDLTEEQFRQMMEVNYFVYPEFKVIWEKDYSDKTLKEAIELMNMYNYIHTDVPIKKIIDDDI